MRGDRRPARPPTPSARVGMGRGSRRGGDVGYSCNNLYEVGAFLFVPFDLFRHLNYGYSLNKDDKGPQGL